MILSTAIPVSSGELLTLVKGLLLNEKSEGMHVKKFEIELAKHLDSKKVFACNAGRTALYLALQSLRLAPGDEVLVPAYTCPVVFEAVLRLGLKPVFVDVDLDTFNIDPELILKAVTPRTKVIVPVHLFGRPCNMGQITEAAKQYGLHVVEDAAQALGAEYRGKKVGSLGDLAIFSFGLGKSITGGEGGAIAVNNPELMESVESLHSQLPCPDSRWSLHIARKILAMKVFANPHLYGLIRGSVNSYLEEADRMIIKNCLSLFEGKGSVLYPTFKQSKMPDLSAEIIAKQLLRLDDLNEKRIMNANKLAVLLKSENGKKIWLPTSNLDAKNTFTRFAVRIIRGNRDFVTKKMLKRNIDTNELFYYIQKLLQKLSKGRSFPNAEVLSDSLLTLPNHPLLTETDLMEISATFVSTLRAM